MNKLWIFANVDFTLYLVTTQSEQITRLCLVSLPKLPMPVIIAAITTCLARHVIERKDVECPKKRVTKNTGEFQAVTSAICVCINIYIYTYVYLCYWVGCLIALLNVGNALSLQ